MLTAEVGRGIVSLTQCAVAGGNAFVLSPAKVARRSRFDADLSLERCTIAAEKSFVTLEAWPGSAPGPDRPWLVFSRDTAYMASYTPPSRESVLLKVEPNSLAQGALFWQGHNDAYEVQNFTARADKPVVQTARPDVRQWTNLWGTNHFRNPSGPSVRGVSSYRLLNKLRPGNVTPGDLAAFDPDDHPGDKELTLGIDLKTPSRSRPAPRARSEHRSESAAPTSRPDAQLVCHMVDFRAA